MDAHETRLPTRGFTSGFHRRK